MWTAHVVPVEFRRGGSEFLELELHMVASCLVHAGNQTSQRPASILKHWVSSRKLAFKWYSWAWIFCSEGSRLLHSLAGVRALSLFLQEVKLCHHSPLSHCSLIDTLVSSSENLQHAQGRRWAIPSSASLPQNLKGNICKEHKENID